MTKNYVGWKNLPERVKEQRRAVNRSYGRTPRGKDVNRRAQLKHKYGLTQEHYDALLLEQGGKCALCDKPSTDPRLNVDHCHESGRVRGLLCWKHNSALGMLGDDEEGLMRAIQYLRRRKP